MSVRRVVPGEEVAAREVRLRALADSPHEFDTTLEESRRWSEEEWKAWIHRHQASLPGVPGRPRRGVSVRVPATG